MTLRPIRVLINVVQIDEHDRLSETGGLQFDGDETGTAVEKAREFLDKLTPGDAVNG